MFAVLALASMALLASTCQDAPIEERAQNVAPARKRVLFLAGEDQNGAAYSLRRFARALELGPFETTFVASTDRTELPGLEALEQADLVVLFLRHRMPDETGFRQVLDYVQDGKPLVALRTSTQAFFYPEESSRARWNDDFGAMVLGAVWRFDYGPESSTAVKLTGSKRDHPILRGVAEDFEVASPLYHVLPLSKGCRILAMGTSRGPGPIPDLARAENPVAWTLNRGSSRVFYTSLGHIDDFEVPAFRRMLANAVYWALELDVPDTIRGIDTGPTWSLSDTGVVESIEDNRIHLRNGLRGKTLRLADPSEAENLRPFVGTGVRLDYLSFEDGGSPEVGGVRPTVLIEKTEVPALRLVVLPKNRRLEFGERLAVSGTLMNRSAAPVTLAHDEPVLLAFLLRQEDGLRVALTTEPGRDDRLGVHLDGVTLQPFEALELEFEFENLLQPGRYSLRAEGPADHGIRAPFRPTEIEVLSANPEQARRTLLERMQGETEAGRRAIAWVLWKDYASDTGLERLSQELIRAPEADLARFIIRCDGPGTTTAIMEAGHTLDDVEGILEWCEVLGSSPNRQRLFRLMLQSPRLVRHRRIRVSVQEVVARWLVERVFLDADLRQPSSPAERRAFVDAVRELISRQPEALAAADTHPVEPEDFDRELREDLFGILNLR